MSKDKTQEAEMELITDDFKITDKNLQVGFYLNANEKQKLNELAEHKGLGVSALLRMMIIKSWREEVKNGN